MSMAPSSEDPIGDGGGRRLGNGVMEMADVAWSRPRMPQRALNRAYEAS